MPMSRRQSLFLECRTTFSQNKQGIQDMLIQEGGLVEMKSLHVEMN